MVEQRMYINESVFDQLSEKQKLVFLYCPLCKRFYNLVLLEKKCYCNIISR